MPRPPPVEEQEIGPLWAVLGPEQQHILLEVARAMVDASRRHSAPGRPVMVHDDDDQQALEDALGSLAQARSRFRARLVRVIEALLDTE